MADAVNADIRRRQVVARAAGLFDREGYHATNMNAVARAVGLQKATLYHYFSSKNEILHWIHEEFIDLLIEKQESRKDGLSASEELRAMMRDVLELMDTHRGHVRVFFEHYRELSLESQETIRRKRDHYKTFVDGIIVRGVASGEFRDVNVHLTTLAMFGMCNWAYQWYREGGALESRAIADFFCDLLVHGLAPR
jgi:AcrR family transcriptional regulator